MKKSILAGALALFGMTNAQVNSIKANPFALLGGSDLVSYERALNTNSTVGLGAGIGGFKLGGVSYSQAGGQLFYRYYFKQALRGWYGNAGVSYTGGKVKNSLDIHIHDHSHNGFSIDHTDNDEVAFGAFGLQAKAGYQWVWNSGFTLDLNAGLGYINFNYDSKTQNELAPIGLTASGVLPAFGVALGYSF